MYRSLYKKTDGTTGSKLSLEDVPVFRSGTFRDSQGYQHTYDPFHMSQMVSNYDLLKSQNILPDVPVRDGHPGFLLSGMEGNGKVVGWHTGLRTEERVSPVDGEKYTYLLANFDILDEQGQTNVENGLWRNRSSEVGTYISNSEAEFFPVYAGFAYVDIPAVEGLNGFSKTNPGLGTTFSLMMESEEEAPVGVQKHSAAAAEPPVEEPVEGDLAGTGGDPVVEEPVVEEPVVEPPVEEPVVEPVVEEPVVEEGGDFSKGGTPTFQVFGQPTTDFASVQAHILTLEGFAQETSDTNRKAFVKGLVSDKKITGAQQSTLEKFALGLDAEQYTAWCETYTLAPELGLLQLHAAGSSNTDGGEDLKSEAALETAKEIVFSHKRAGMPTAAIEATPSFKKLIKNDPTFTL
jgi:hypothetical protein